MAFEERRRIILILLSAIEFLLLPDLVFNINYNFHSLSISVRWILLFPPSYSYENGGPGHLNNWSKVSKLPGLKPRLRGHQSLFSNECHNDSRYICNLVYLVIIKGHIFECQKCINLCITFYNHTSY